MQAWARASARRQSCYSYRRHAPIDVEFHQAHGEQLHHLARKVFVRTLGCGRLRILVLAKGHCYRHAHGKPLRFPVVTIDITARKRMEDALSAGANAKNSRKQPNTKQELIAANIKLLIEPLEVGKSDALTATSRFHNYSVGNVLEVARQMPDGTRFAGFEGVETAWPFRKARSQGHSHPCPYRGHQAQERRGR
jgi:hypothetical protein